MHAPNEFQEFRKKVDMMLDKALNAEAEQKIMQDAQNNPEFGRLLENERQFRHFVRENLVRPKVTPEFIAAIKEKIRIV